MPQDFYSERTEAAGGREVPEGRADPDPEQALSFWTIFFFFSQGSDSGP